MQSNAPLEPSATTIQVPTLIPPERVDQGARPTSPQGAERKKETEKNMASCGTLALRSRLEEDGSWQPPHVTHNFSYPSDEEIVPNPKANFRATLLPRLGHVRSWFRGAVTKPKSDSSTSQEGASSTAPCLPITTGGGSLSDGDASHHPDMGGGAVLDGSRHPIVAGGGGDVVQPGPGHA